jgi:UDP-N-acetylmuramyl pentapeptide synthase
LKQLEEILDAKHIKNQFDSWDLTINGIAIDSRQVKKDFIFVAYKGTTLD